MNFHVEFDKSVYKYLSKLDKYTTKMILNWIEDRLENCENPRIYGKALSSNLAGIWRYRVGDYRIIAKIIDEKIIVLIIAIGHRKDIYK